MMASDLPAAPVAGSTWRQQLAEALAAVPPGRRRALRALQPAAGGSALLQGPAATLLDLASNDYLGLSRHPAVVAAARACAASDGVGAGASRLVSGSRPVHAELEQALAAWLGRDAVLLFPSGFQANLAAVQALADRHTLVLADRLIHHSLLSGVRCSGARLQRFRHNDLQHLETLLQEARRRQPGQRLLVLGESLFSMQGTSAAVPALVNLAERHDAALLLDEAHALGVLGPGGRGLAHGLPGIGLLSGTFGKAFGSGGAFLAGDQPVMEWLLQSSGAFRYTTALAPPLAAAALAALTWMQQQEAEGRHPGPSLLRRAARWREGLAAAGWPRPPGEGPILPLLVGDDGEAVALQQRLEQAGLLAVAIRPPTVPPGTARLRLVLRQDLPAGSLERLLQALGPPPAQPAPL
jgi:8-amino-7-oxononanoate synthase